MKRQTILFIFSWFAIAIVWITFVSLNRENEGWEWFFRMTIGFNILLLGIVSLPLKGIINEKLKVKAANILTLLLIGAVAGYLASLAIVALISGNLGVVLVLGLFLFGLGSAFIHVWDTTIGAKRRLETIIIWCFQEVKAQSPWVTEKVGQKFFKGYHPKRLVTENDIYEGKITKKVIHKISDEILLELPGIEEKELEVINRFLYVPRLPGVSMSIARQIHQDGIYTPMALKTLSINEWQRYKGIGTKKGESIIAYLNSEEGYRD